MREVIGDRTVDEVLTIGRQEIEARDARSAQSSCQASTDSALASCRCSSKNVHPSARCPELLQ